MGEVLEVFVTGSKSFGEPIFQQEQDEKQILLLVNHRFTRFEFSDSQLEISRFYFTKPPNDVSVYLMVLSKRTNFTHESLKRNWKFRFIEADHSPRLVNLNLSY